MTPLSSEGVSGTAANASDTPAIQISSLNFSWKHTRKTVLNIENLTIWKKERVFIKGPSGSGKSTLLSLLAGVNVPQQGSVYVNGTRIDTFSGAKRDHFRADHIGFIYQMFNLLPYLSVIENVTLPCRFSVQRRDKAILRSKDLHTEALRILSKLNMAEPELINRPVMELSVGQRQRVAAARALIGSPEILIADEPTSSLDSDHRETFIQLLFQECNREDITLVFVSHDQFLAKYFDRTIELPEINKR